MARRSTRHFVRPAPRTMIWIGASLPTVTVSSSNQLLTVLSAGALLLRPFTIVRTRQLIRFESDQGAASESEMAAYTRQVVTTAAATAGVGSLPGGIDEPDSDFFVYQPIAQTFCFGSAIGFQVKNGPGDYWMVDSKAMRKVGIDDQVVGVIDVQAQLGSKIEIVGRTLIKLH